jgi:cellulose synthase/poly-beta-1,6-N-acetylglucosamine synthase-like glycosyltransferase
MILFMMVNPFLRYFIAILLKWGIPSARVKKDYALEPKVSVLMPTFNEGLRAYETIASIVHSDYPAEKLELIAIDDCSSDDSYEWLLKAGAEFPNVKVSRNEVNRGKPATFLRAFSQSTGEIVIQIDSDCIFAKNTLHELMSCFSEPRMGAVGGAVNVKNVNENTLTMAQTLVYYTQFHLLRVIESATRTVACISGCMFAIRREVLESILPSIEGRNWLGIPVHEGEDRFMAHLVLLSGHGTYINPDAQCWTHVPSTLTQFLKQQIRWYRGTMRDFLLTVKTLPSNVWRLHPNAVYSLVILPMQMIFTVFLTAYLMFTGLSWMIPAGLLSYAMTAAVFHAITRKYQKDQAVDTPHMLVVLAVWPVVSVILTLYALCTFDHTDWGTREKVHEI